MLHSLRPHYAKNFRCIGPECEDTCCQGWDVVIDKGAYHDLQSLPKFQPKAKDYLVVITNPTQSEYARIQLTPENTCPFLSSERLCSIQQQYGERYLPGICASYPRATRTIDGLKETALLLACPEAARLVLLNPDLVQPEESGASRYSRFTHFGEKPVKTNGSPHQFLWELRAFTLLLLRDRDYLLWQRLFLLGMFSKRLKEITDTGELGLVPLLLQEHSTMIIEGKLRPAMDGIPVRTGPRLVTLLEIIKRHLDTTAGKHARFRECVKDFLTGIRCDDKTPIEACGPVYEDNYSRYGRPFLDRHPYMLENYLINFVFRSRFPYGIDSAGNPSTPVLDFLLMGILYALIRDLIVGASGLYRENLNSGHIVKIVQSVAKSMEQCPRFPLADYASLANADGMALLLKNNC
jgi:lysine-N-methylase